MTNYLMHIEMGRARIFTPDEVIAEAAKVLQEVDFGEYTQEGLVREFVDAMNGAFCTGKLGSRKEPSVNEIRRITGLAWILTRASAEAKQLPLDLLAAIQGRA